MSKDSSVVFGQTVSGRGVPESADGWVVCVPHPSLCHPIARDFSVADELESHAQDHHGDAGLCGWRRAVMRRLRMLIAHTLCYMLALGRLGPMISNHSPLGSAAKANGPNSAYSIVIVTPADFSLSHAAAASAAAKPR